MRKFVFVLLGMAVAATALAEPVWSRPGWYQVSDVSDGTRFIYQGPFEDEATCRSAMPDDDIVDHFHCDFLDRQPDYDVNQ